MTTIALLQGAGNSAAALFVQILPILAIGLVFYFLVIAPANKQRRKTQEMLSSIKKGDRVVTSVARGVSNPTLVTTSLVSHLSSVIALV